jgi:hypothetical protein
MKAKAKGWLVDEAAVGKIYKENNVIDFKKDN